MANVVAGLAVLLGLDSTEYTRGLTKAEYQAKKFAQNTRAAILEVGKVLGSLAIADTVIENTKAIIAEAAALDDFADATGSSVEALSKLNNQAKISGTDFATLQTAVLKLSAGMAGTDENATKAKEALKALGVTTKDPAQAMQEVAIALDKFEDGVNKVGIAVALFGKGGAALLPMLKDMAQLQDVQATVTAKQAQEAEELEKAWRRLAYESTTFKNAILSNVVPVLLEAIQNFNDARKAGLGFLDALRLAGQSSSDVSDQIAVVSEKLEDAKKAVAAAANNPLRFIPGLTADIRDVEKLEKELRALRTINVRGLEVFDKEKIKPAAPALSGAGGGGRAKALKEATDEGLRYQESLEKQLQATLKLSHAEEAEVAIFDAMAKGQAGFTAERQAIIRDMAQQLDTTEALKKAEEERKKSQEQIQHATNSAIKSAEQETESIKQGNEQLQEQIAFLRGGQEALDRMTDARLADAIATKEQTLAAYESSRANEQLIAQTEEQIRLLKERRVLIGDKRAAEAAAEEAKKAKQYADDLGHALAQGAENAILHFNNLRGVLKGLEQDLLRIMTRKLVTQPLGDWLSGIIGAGIGGTSGMPAGTIQNFQFGRASGGPVAAGEPYMVGERGPELFIPKQSGSIVANNKMGGSFVFNINVPAGANKSTIDQTRVQFGLALQAAMDRNS